MPRIPVILADQSIAAPQSPRMPSQPPGGVPGAILGAGEAVGNAFTRMAELEQSQRIAGARVEVDSAISRLKDDYDRKRTGLVELGQPEQFAQRASDIFDNLSTAAAQGLRYPEARGLFQKKVIELQSETSIKARAEGVRLQHAQTNARATLLDRQDAADSVFSTTPEDRASALQRLVTRDKDLVATGARTTSALPQHLSDIDEATARRDFDNPALRSQVLAGLTAGRYNAMAPDKQLTLRDSLITKAHSERDQERKDEDRIRTETADEAERSIVDLVRTKDWAQARSMLSRYGQYMKGEEKKTWDDYISKAQTTVKSDPATRTNLSLIVYSADTTSTISSARASVMRAVGQGQLDATDGDKFLGHLQGAAVADRNRREDKQLDAYHRSRSEVRDLIKEDLRVTGPLEKLVPAAQNTLSMALDDMERNVPVEGPKGEAPRDWYNRTRAQWIARVDSAATSRIAELEKGIDENAVRQDLERYRAAGQRPPKEVWDRIRRLMDAETIREEQAILTGKGKPAPGEKKSVGGKPEGGKKLGY